MYTKYFLMYTEFTLEFSTTVYNVKLRITIDDVDYIERAYNMEILLHMLVEYRSIIIIFRQHDKYSEISVHQVSKSGDVDYLGIQPRQFKIKKHIGRLYGTNFG